MPFGKSMLTVPLLKGFAKKISVNSKLTLNCIFKRIDVQTNYNVQSQNKYRLRLHTVFSFTHQNDIILLQNATHLCLY